MAIIGMSFNKLNVEKKKAVKGKINIHNNVAITNIDDQDISIGEGKKSLKFGFEFTTDYKENVGKIEIAGDVVYLEDAKETKKIMDHWKKNKAVIEPTRTRIMDKILENANIQAIILSKEIGLPPPIRLPHVAKGNE